MVSPLERLREAQILWRLKITYYREPVVDVGRIDEGEILFSLDRDRVLAVKNHARHQARGFRVPDSHVALIVQPRSVGKRAHQGWATIHNCVVWKDLLSQSQLR